MASSQLYKTERMYNLKVVFSTPYFSLTSLMCEPLLNTSVKIESALSKKIRDESDVGLKILFVK